MYYAPVTVTLVQFDHRQSDVTLLLIFAVIVFLSLVVLLFFFQKYVLPCLLQDLYKNIADWILYYFIEL